MTLWIYFHYCAKIGIMITHTAQETIEAGVYFAKKLRGGEILALNGDLGSGKTTFIKGLAQGLGIKENITSPTFVLLKEYQTLKSNLRGGILVHVDAYRIERSEDIESVGIEDYFNHRDVILAVEWAEKIKKILPKDRINISFETLDENRRKISFKITKENQK